MTKARSTFLFAFQRVRITGKKASKLDVLAWFDNDAVLTSGCHRSDSTSGIACFPEWTRASKPQLA